MTTREFERTGREMLGLPFPPSIHPPSDEERKLRSHFGISFEICSKLWRRLDPTNKISQEATPKHLLWSLCFLCVNAAEFVGSTVVGASNRKHYREWSWLFIKAISELEEDLIRWDNRFLGWDGSTSSLVTVDGTDCRILEPSPYSPIWWSHKFNGAGVKYEVCVNIKTGNIVNISGLWPAGVKDDENF